MSYAGSRLERTAQRVAARMGVSVVLGEVDGSGHGLEQAVIWTQPRRRSYSYIPPVQGLAFREVDEAADIDAMDVGQAIMDRIAYVDVILRASGSAESLDALSRRFLTAMDYVRGAAEAGRGRWFIDGPGEGGGADPTEGVYEETMRIGLRYPVIRDEFVLAPVKIDVSANGAGAGVYVNGPDDSGPEELAL